MKAYESIHVEQQQGVSIVRLLDDKVMDSDRIQTLDEELLEVAEQSESGELLLNLENVRFLSSAAINRLIVLDRRVKMRGGSIRLANLRPEVRDVFSITNLDRVFKIFPDTGQAVQSFGTPG